VSARELRELLIDSGNENIEQTNLWVKGKGTSICCVLKTIRANPDRGGFGASKKNDTGVKILILRDKKRDFF